MLANENQVVSKEHLKKIQNNLEIEFSSILCKLGFDIDKDQNLCGTPKRIAYMYVNELLKGCYTKEPKVTVFLNKTKINSMVVLGPIRVNSLCSHHFVPFLGDAFVGYIPDKKITGISKLARIVDWFARRPQIQEELGEQISNFVINKLQPKGCGVYIKAQHGCMQIRGIMEPNAYMTTMSLKGVFLTEQKTKEEFLHYIGVSK